MTNDSLIAILSTEDPAVFQTRFWRSHRLLYFIACRVLGDAERAADAVENCWVSASQNPPRFEYEGEFRSWLLRVLIDEALALRRKSTGAQAVSHQEHTVLRSELSQGLSTNPE